MKKLIIFLLITQNLNAQTFNYRLPKHRIISDKARFITIVIASTVFNAVGDGLNANPKTKPLGHAFNALSIGTLAASPFLMDYNKKKWYIYGLSLIFIRGGVFDPTYNLTRGLPYNYSGNSCMWDKFWNKAGGRNGFDMGLFITVGVALPLNEL
jgi:hypothetical protein